MKTVTGRVEIGTGSGEGAHGRSDTGAFDSLQSFLDELRAVGEQYDVLIQAFDARYIAGDGHLEAALAHATRSMDREENVADELAVEVLLYAAGRRQIDQAMTIGLGSGDQSVIVLLDGERAPEAAVAVRDLIEPGPVEPDAAAITDYFDITPAEQRAASGNLEALVRERVALLDVEK